MKAFDHGLIQGLSYCVFLIIFGCTQRERAVPGYEIGNSRQDPHGTGDRAVHSSDAVSMFLHLFFILRFGAAKLRYIDNLRFSSKGMVRINPGRNNSVATARFLFHKTEDASD